jgi:hypothetical protein
MDPELTRRFVALHVWNQGQLHLLTCSGFNVEIVTEEIKSLLAGGGALVHIRITAGPLGTKKRMRAASSLDENSGSRFRRMCRNP